MITAIIIDDDKSCITTLEQLLKKYCSNVSVLGSAYDIKDGTQLVNIKKPELVFLDVELNGESGFDLFSSVTFTDFQIIFTTAHEKYAIRAIKSSCLEYLLKPIDFNELKTAVDKFEKPKGLPAINHKIEALLSNISNSDLKQTKIIIPGHDSYTFLNTGEIICCEADLNYTNIYLNKGEKIVSTKNLKEFEESLSRDIFFRCHKSWLINLNCIKKFLKPDNKVIMMNDLQIDISLRKKEEFLSLFKKF